MRSTLPLIIQVTPIELHTYGVWFVTDWDEIHVLAMMDDLQSVRQALMERLNGK